MAFKGANKRAKRARAKISSWLLRTRMELANFVKIKARKIGETPRKMKDRSLVMASESKLFHPLLKVHLKLWLKKNKETSQGLLTRYNYIKNQIESSRTFNDMKENYSHDLLFPQPLKDDLLLTAYLKAKEFAPTKKKAVRDLTINEAEELYSIGVFLNDLTYKRGVYLGVEEIRKQFSSATKARTRAYLEILKKLAEKG